MSEQVEPGSIAAEQRTLQTLFHKLDLPWPPRDPFQPFTGACGQFETADRSGANVRLIYARILNPKALRLLSELALFARISHSAFPDVISVTASPLGVAASRKISSAISLQDLLEEQPDGMAESRALKLMLQMTQIVSLIHRSGFVLLTAGLAAFRYARQDKRVLLDSAELSLPLDSQYAKANLRSSTVLGLLDYLAPEQTQGVEALTFATDIFGLGASLFRLLTGRAIYETSSLNELLDQARHGHVRRIEDWRRDLAPGTRELLQRCLQRKPSERYQSCLQLEQAVRRQLKTLDETPLEFPMATLQLETGELPEDAPFSTRLRGNLDDLLRWLTDSIGLQSDGLLVNPDKLAQNDPVVSAMDPSAVSDPMERDSEMLERERAALYDSISPSAKALHMQLHPLIRAAREAAERKANRGLFSRLKDGILGRKKRPEDDFSHLSAAELAQHLLKREVAAPLLAEPAKPTAPAIVAAEAIYAQPLEAEELTETENKVSTAETLASPAASEVLQASAVEPVVPALKARAITPYDRNLFESRLDRQLVELLDGESRRAVRESKLLSIAVRLEKQVRGAAFLDYWQRKCALRLKWAESATRSEAVQFSANLREWLVSELLVEPTELHPEPERNLEDTLIRQLSAASLQQSRAAELCSLLLAREQAHRAAALKVCYFLRKSLLRIMRAEMWMLAREKGHEERDALLTTQRRLIESQALSQARRQAKRYVSFYDRNLRAYREHRRHEAEHPRTSHKLAAQAALETSYRQQAQAEIEGYFKVLIARRLAGNVDRKAQSRSLDERQRLQNQLDRLSALAESFNQARITAARTVKKLTDLMRSSEQAITQALERERQEAEALMQARQRQRLAAATEAAQRDSDRIQIGAVRARLRYLSHIDEEVSRHARNRSLERRLQEEERQARQQADETVHTQWRRILHAEQDRLKRLARQRRERLRNERERTQKEIHVQVAFELYEARVLLETECQANGSESLYAKLDTEHQARENAERVVRLARKAAFEAESARLALERKRESVRMAEQTCELRVLAECGRASELERIEVAAVALEDRTYSAAIKLAEQETNRLRTEELNRRLQRIRAIAERKRQTIEAQTRNRWCARCTDLLAIRLAVERDRPEIKAAVKVSELEASARASARLNATQAAQPRHAVLRTFYTHRIWMTRVARTLLKRLEREENVRKSLAQRAALLESKTGCERQALCQTIAHQLDTARIQLLAHFVDRLAKARSANEVSTSSHALNLQAMLEQWQMEALMEARSCAALARTRTNVLEQERRRTLRQEKRERARIEREQAKRQIATQLADEMLAGFFESYALAIRTERESAGRTQSLASTSREQAAAHVAYETQRQRVGYRSWWQREAAVKAMQKRLAIRTRQETDAQYAYASLNAERYAIEIAARGEARHHRVREVVRARIERRTYLALQNARLRVREERAALTGIGDFAKKRRSMQYSTTESARKEMHLAAWVARAQLAAMETHVRAERRARNEQEAFGAAKFELVRLQGIEKLARQQAQQQAARRAIGLRKDTLMQRMYGEVQTRSNLDLRRNAYSEIDRRARENLEDKTRDHARLALKTETERARRMLLLQLHRDRAAARDRREMRLIERQRIRRQQAHEQETLTRYQAQKEVAPERSRLLRQRLFEKIASRLQRHVQHQRSIRNRAQHNLRHELIAELNAREFARRYANADAAAARITFADWCLIVRRTAQARQAWEQRVALESSAQLHIYSRIQLQHRERQERLGFRGQLEFQLQREREKIVRERWLRRTARWLQARTAQEIGSSQTAHTFIACSVRAAEESRSASQRVVVGEYERVSQNESLRRIVERASLSAALQLEDCLQLQETINRVLTNRIDQARNEEERQRLVFAQPANRLLSAARRAQREWLEHCRALFRTERLLRQRIETELALRKNETNRLRSLKGQATRRIKIDRVLADELVELRSAEERARRQRELEQLEALRQRRRMERERREEEERLQIERERLSQNRERRKVELEAQLARELKEKQESEAAAWAKLEEQERQQRETRLRELKEKLGKSGSGNSKR